MDNLYFNPVNQEQNFTVYKSSAGSGKTFTLVKEYLKIALGSQQSDRYRGILAITFTNKAAKEMKERIIDSLTKCTNNEAFDMLDILCEELNESESVLCERATKTLEHILHHYADFGISTIDKFVHKIVRTFAHDLKIPINFEVEMDGEQLISSAVDQLLEQVGSNQELTKVLIEFTEGKTDDEKSWHIENDIKDYAKNLLKEEGQLHIERLRNLKLKDFFKLRNSIHKKVKDAELNISTIGNEGIEIINSKEIEKTSFFGGGAVPTYFKYLAEVKIKNLEPTATLQKIIDGGKWFSGKCTPADRASIENIQDELTNLYHKSTKIIETSLSDLILYQSIEKNIYALALLNEIEEEINLIKQEQNILHISEFNKKIAKIVLNEPAPFIYERLGERYRNYLIDEFQDTSELQFQNLLPL
ncbi:MAG: UvrD-helicase domain-containing protein, partial [Flavobacteriales bacterium]|nr:UvrD-helicase domain-containing protein [Flavobacteriales bacterium]